MSFVFEGYSQPEKSSEQEFIFEGFKEPVSKSRSAISAPIKGLIKGLQNLNPLSPSGPIPQELGERITEEVLPTKKEHRYLERAGKLAPFALTGPEGIGLKALQLALGTAGGEIAEEAGAGNLSQAISELAGMSLPGLARTGAKKGIEKVTELIKAPKEKLPSGLSKPRALEAKYAEKGIISPERQESSIKKLNEEASKLTKESIEKELPISKQIQQGFDFEKKFEQDFGKIQKLADKANPDIDITDISNLLSKTTQRYRGIPKLHPEAEKVMTEVRALRKQPQTSLKNLLRIYRSNNQKIRNIYETSRLTGKQQEYVDFLVDLNRNISKSFERTLPEDSAWLKRFKEANSNYKQYRDSLKTLNILNPILEQRATPASLQKFASDPKLQNKLQLSMGKEGADQIIKIAKDLKSAQDAIKRIPAKELKIWDAIFPVGMFIPFIKIPAFIPGLKKMYDWLRRGYGLFLTTSSRRKAYNKALKAIVDKDFESYKEATNILKMELEKKPESSSIEFKK